MAEVRDESLDGLELPVNEADARRVGQDAEVEYLDCRQPVTVRHAEACAGGMLRIGVADRQLRHAPRPDDAPAVTASGTA